MVFKLTCHTPTFVVFKMLSFLDQSVYKKKDKVLIALASWADGPARIELKIDWDALGMDPSKVKMTAPAVKDYQDEMEFTASESFQVPEGKGYLIIIE